MTINVIYSSITRPSACSIVFGKFFSGSFGRVIVLNFLNFVVFITELTSDIKNKVIGKGSEGVENSLNPQLP